MQSYLQSEIFLSNSVDMMKNLSMVKKYKTIKIIETVVRGILQKLLKYWTIRWQDDRPSNPATQHIILDID